MVHLRTRTAERRRDPRFALVGSARLSAREPLAVVECALVDVSAGGLRVSLLPLRADAAALTTVGVEVDVEVTVRDASGATGVPTIHLRGRGAVVRCSSAPGDAGPTRAPSSPIDLAVRLDGPLGFREYLSGVRVF